MLACKAYRDFAFATRGITEPEIVVPHTAHAAFDKAADWLRLEIRKIPLDPTTLMVDVRKMRKAINKNTILVRVCCFSSTDRGLVNQIAHGPSRSDLGNDVLYTSHIVDTTSASICQLVHCSSWEALRAILTVSSTRLRKSQRSASRITFRCMSTAA